MEIGEFELIDRIRGRFPTPEGLVGIGDDCAVMPQKDGNDTLVSTDMLIEGVHFLLGEISPEDLGWKSAAVNLSDIAAMGGSPVGTFLSIAIPSSIDAGWMDRFTDGFGELSRIFGVPLLGGDTTASRDSLCINVTVLGECPSGKAKRRSDALPGDLVCVTGTLGDSAAGLKLILGTEVRDSELVRRHYRPMPRIREGAALALCDGVHAMMDISDGIASDLRHITGASGTGAEIDLGRLPLSRELKSECLERGWDPLELAAGGGEDYELLFTMDPSCSPAVPHTVIGRITTGGTIAWKGGGKDSYEGFKHF